MSKSLLVKKLGTLNDKNSDGNSKRSKSNNSRLMIPEAELPPKLEEVQMAAKVVQPKGLARQRSNQEISHSNIGGMVFA